MIHCRVHGSFRGRLNAGAPHDGLQVGRQLDVKSAVRNARGDDFEIANTFVPAGTLVPSKADLCWFKTGFGPDAFGQLAATALERRASPDNGEQDVRGLEQISSNLVVAALGDAASAGLLCSMIRPHKNSSELHVESSLP